jgi:DNA-binding transcriptional MerR regulator
VDDRLPHFGTGRVGGASADDVELLRPGRLATRASIVRRFRLYDDDAIGRVHVISAGKYLGLPLQEICDILSALEGGLCAEVHDRLRPALSTRLEETRQQLEALATVSPCLADAIAGLDGAPRERDYGTTACIGVPAVAELDRFGAAAMSPHNVPTSVDVPIACSL